MSGQQIPAAEPDLALSANWLIANLPDRSAMCVLVAMLRLAAQRDGAPRSSASIAELAALSGVSLAQVKREAQWLRTVDWRGALLAPQTAAVEVTPPPPKRARAKRVGADYPLPPELDTPAFRAAWCEWHAYRRERGETPWVESVCRKWVATFLEWGVVRSIAALDHTIRSSWSKPREAEEGVLRFRPTAAPAPAVSTQTLLETAKSEARDELWVRCDQGRITEERRDELDAHLKKLGDQASVKRFLRELGHEVANRAGLAGATP